MGARPMHRLIAKEIKVPLARKIIKLNLQKQTISVDVKNGNIKIGA